MLIDKNLLMGSEQALTATAASSDYIDLGSARDIGNGEPLELLVLCTVLPVSAGSTTLVVELQTDDNTSFSSPTTLAQTPAIAKASIVAGTELLRIKVPHGCERYLRVYYTVAVADFSAGKFTAALVPERQANVAYPRGYTV